MTVELKEIPCAINPQKICPPGCPNYPEAKRVALETIQALMDRYSMSEQEALTEYKAGDPIFRFQIVPDEFANTCPNSPTKKKSIHLV